MIKPAIHLDKDSKVATKKIIYLTINRKLGLLFSLIIISIGFVIFSKSNILISDALIGSGILISGYALRKLSTK